MKASEAIVAALAAEGVDTVFGLIGGGVDLLAAQIADHSQIRFVKVRHEEVAVGMADGYSRATGKVGVALVDSHPGVANASAPMLAARMGGSHVIVLYPYSVGLSRYDYALTNRQLNQNYDQAPLLGATIGAWDLIRSPATLSTDIALAFRRVRQDRGPLALAVTDQDAEMPAGWSYSPKGLSRVDRLTVTPGQDDVAKLAAMLHASKRPVLLAGRGAFRSGAREALIALADRSGALIATTLLAKDWFQNYPYAVGLSGGFSTDDAFAVLRDADLVIAFGASLNDYTMAHGKLYKDARIAQVDISPGAIDEYRQVDLAVIGDAKLTAQMLTTGMERTERPDWHGQAMAKRIAGFNRWRGLDLSERPGGANPRMVVDALDRLVPRERLLCVDIGLFMGVPSPYMTVQSPADIVFPWALGRMGVALPVAAGAAIGRSDRLVTVFVGDGGVMASLNALDTLRSEKIPILIVVMDDGGFGAERRIFQLHGVDASVDDYTTPKLESVAKALGIQAFTVRSAREMEQVLHGRDVRRQTTLIHVIMDRAVPATEMDRAIYNHDAPRSI